MKYLFAIVICIYFPNALGADNIINVLEPTGKVNRSGQLDDFGFMRTDDNNIVFISPTEYIDIDNMTILRLELPESINGNRFFYSRPPFSNNIIPVMSFAHIPDLYIYDINNNEYILSEYSSWVLFPDNDREYVSFTIESPDWWLGNISSSFFWLMSKDGIIYSSDSYFNRRGLRYGDPFDYIISEFIGTVFDDNYIMETIQNINETKINIISRNTVRFSHGRFSDNSGDNEISMFPYLRSNAFYYFINRMENYFNISIQNIFQFEDMYFLRENNIGIYENGFFIFGGNKVMLLDIKNNKTSIYTINEIPFDFETEPWNVSRIFISNDGTTLLLRLHFHPNRNRTRECIIYKYEL